MIMVVKEEHLKKHRFLMFVTDSGIIMEDKNMHP
jgi:hypothetical protein